MADLTDANAGANTVSDRWTRLGTRSMDVILGDHPCRPVSPDISTTMGLMAAPGY